MHQVVSKDTVLSAVGFVAHHNDVVIRIDWCGLGVVELLNKREDKGDLEDRTFKKVYKISVSQVYHKYIKKSDKK